MTDLLLRFLTKKHKDPASPSVRYSIGKLAGMVGIVCNVLLFAAKLVVGLLANSVSIVADAANNLSDAASSISTLLGFRLAQKPADREHPFGHARYEYLSGLVVAALILLMGAEMLENSIGKLIHPVEVIITPVTFWVLVGSVLVKLWLWAFYSSLGKQLCSSTLRASGTDSRNDVIATSCVLLGCGITRFMGVNVDGYIGIAVALFIFWSGIQVARETISPLLGKRADDALIAQLYSLVLSHEGILGAHDLLVHDYGPGRYYASLHVEMSDHISPGDCHGIIDHMEQEALEKWDIHLVIHYDPVPGENAGLSDQK